MAFRRKLFLPRWPSIPAFVVGSALIAVELLVFWWVQRDLGAARLVGKTEISGTGEIERSGLYGKVRHPRYTASLLAIVGACLLAGTGRAWTVAAVWLVLMAIVLSLEEREMRRRFGQSYVDYCRQVPRFILLPRRFRNG